MLKTISPSLLRAPQPEPAPANEPSSADPAGFSSLLRQQGQAGTPTPTPTPSPTATTPSPTPPARAAHQDAPKRHEAVPSTREQGPAPAAAPERREADDAAENIEPAVPARGRGLVPRPRLGQADAGSRAVAETKRDPARAGLDDAAPAATVTAVDTQATGAPVHPAQPDGLAALQAQASVAMPARTDAGESAAIDAGIASDAASRRAAAHPTDPMRDIAPPAATASHLAIASHDNAAGAADFAAALARPRDAEPGTHDGSPRLAAVGAPSIPILASTSTLPGDPGTPVSVTLPTPFDAPDFAQSLGVQLSVLAKDGVQRAELHLNPADMGPVSVQIVMDGTQARIDFGADVAATRHAIEAGLPELASALRDAGYTLAGGGVSQHAGQRGQQGSAHTTPDGGTQRRGAAPVSDDAVTRAGHAARRIVSQGGVDLYA